MPAGGGFGDHFHDIDIDFDIGQVDRFDAPLFRERLKDDGLIQNLFVDDDLLNGFVVFARLFHRRLNLAFRDKFPVDEDLYDPFRIGCAFGCRGRHVS